MPLPRLLRTASVRLAALYLVLFTVSALVLGAAVFLAARAELARQMTARIESEAAFLGNEFRRGGPDRLLRLVRERERGVGALHYLVQDGAGKALAGELPGPMRQPPGWTVARITTPREDDAQPDEVSVLLTDLGGGLTLAVGDDLGRIGEVQEAIATALAGAVGLAALLGVGGGVLLSRGFLARVDAITRTAEAIIAGDLTRRVPVRGAGDDLDRLAGTLNRMLDRIAALMDSLRQVSSDVAHDLRTPLSRLCHRLEEALSHARTVPEYEAAVEGAVREAEGLLQTFSALLRIAQVEGGSPRAGFRVVDLSMTAETVADAYRPDAEDGGRHLVTIIDPGVSVLGDAELLTQALANLVENAMRHTPPGTCIRVGLSKSGQGGVRLDVWDNGPGVADADLPRVLGRFYRGERSRTTPGNGLGLSLVAAVADLHGAKLALANAGPGLRVTLVFPGQGGPG